MGQSKETLFILKDISRYDVAGSIFWSTTKDKSMAFDIKDYLHLSDIGMKDFLNYQHLIFALNDKFRTKISDFIILKVEDRSPMYWRLYIKRSNKYFLSSRPRGDNFQLIKYERIRSFTDGWLLAKRD